VNRTNAPYGFYIKKGYFTPKWSGSPVPKYQCKACKKFFSASTFKDTYRQQKPYINQQFYQDLCAGKTLRRQSLHLNIARETLARRLIWLGDKVKHIHQWELNHGIFKRMAPQLGLFQFDEMETFINSRLKTISVPLAVCRIPTPDRMVKDPKTKPVQMRYRSLIVDISVAERPAKGHIAALSRQLFPLWALPGNYSRQDAIVDVLFSLSKVAPATATVTSDMYPDYGSLLGKAMPSAIHNPVKSRKISWKKDYDPLFYLNHTCASIRADLCRMRRRTWATSKSIKYLIAHLFVYLGWHNGYTVL
jgi:transposase-like protein